MAERFTWEFRREDIAQNIRKYGLENFLRWPVSAEALYSADETYMARRLEKIEKYNLSQYCTPFKTGNPPTHALYDPHLVLQAYHLSKLLDTGYRINPGDLFYEFGGGFGAMALLFRRMGYHGYYTIQDLPELIEIQKYFLSREGADYNIIYTSVTEKNDYNLFIANCSLNEVSERIRDAVWRNQCAHDAYEICYDVNWDRMRDIMSDLTKKRPDMVWTNTTDPIFPNHAYLIGVRK